VARRDLQVIVIGAGMGGLSAAQKLEAPPLTITGSVGSPLNPLAIK